MEGVSVLDEIGKNFGLRVKMLVDAWIQEKSEAELAIQVGEEDGEKRLKEVQNSLISLDAVAGNIYSLNRDLGMIPKEANFIRENVLRASVPFLDAYFTQAENRLKSFQEGRKVQTMGAAPIESSFYPEGEKYDWYNPMDQIRAAEFKTAQTAYNAYQGLTAPLSDLMNTAAKVAVGLTALWVIRQIVSSKTKQKAKE